jgi:hypothetical protein
MLASHGFRTGLGRQLGWTVPALAFMTLAGACDGGVVVGEPPPGAGGAGGGASSASSASSASAGGDSTSVASSGSTSATSGTSGGGGSGGWEMKEVCFSWDAGPCPPKEEALQYMSQCGFSIYSVDDGPFEKEGMCCYLVSGVPNPC